MDVKGDRAPRKNQNILSLKRMVHKVGVAVGFFFLFFNICFLIFLLKIKKKKNYRLLSKTFFNFSFYFL